MRRLSALPCALRSRLPERIGRRLTPTEEAVLGVLRRAVRVGYPALHCTVDELRLLVNRCERSVQNALAGLGQCSSRCAPGCVRHVDLVRRVPLFENVAWSDVASRRSYKRRQIASVYLLTERAPHPGRHRPMSPRRAAAAANPRPGGGGAGFAGERSAALQGRSDDPGGGARDRAGEPCSLDLDRAGRPAGPRPFEPPLADTGRDRPTLAPEWARELERLEQLLEEPS